MLGYMGWLITAVVVDLISDGIDFRVCRDSIKHTVVITTEDENLDDEYKLMFDHHMKCIGVFYRDDEYGDFPEVEDLWQTLPEFSEEGTKNDSSK